MGNAAGKIPEIADADVVDKVTALRVNRGDAGRSKEHVGPFRLLMPVKLADAARVQPHVHAGDRFRNAKFPRGDLPSPAAARLPDMRIGEGKPEIRQSSGIGRRRIEEIRILSFPRNVAWDRVRAANARRPARLGSLLGGASGGCAEKRACADRGRENIPSRELTHHDLPFGVRSPTSGEKNPFARGPVSGVRQTWAGGPHATSGARQRSV